MTDLVNQGNGSVLALYGTNDHRFLQVVKERCDFHKVDFYNPEQMKSQIMAEATEIYGLGNDR